jgi:membrane-bound lytic murein transglycosylase A
VRGVDLTDTGVLTGYFEPLLAGSRVRTQYFQHPVYGVPADLLLLDARLLDPVRPPAYARIDGRNVIPVSREALSGATATETGLYRLDVSQAPAGLRDRKLRVRLSGERIVPYSTRQEIEQYGLTSAEPIAWVDDPDLLYILHIQGSGRIRLTSGETLRVAFGEQNGHPFLPKVATESSPPVRTRGLTDRSTPTSAEARSVEVQRVIDQLLAQAAASTAAKNAAPAKVQPSRTEPSPRPGVSPPASPVPRVAASSRLPEAAGGFGEATPRPPSRPRILVSSISDPSYVFFRQIPNTDAGPPGALGVPLTAGQSLAVDPRVTPLGAPVVIAARRSDAAGLTTRLMVAQDTGGAIRGAVRADYFWGFGPSAGVSAMRMKDELRMWVLLPRSLDIASKHTQLLRTRGASGAAQAECMLEDPELCVE